jgi:hypothetical protein
MSVLQVSSVRMVVKVQILRDTQEPTFITTGYKMLLIQTKYKHNNISKHLKNLIKIGYLSINIIL